MTPNKYIEAVTALKQSDGIYRELNKQISKVHGCNDFYPQQWGINSTLNKHFVSVLDDALLELTGFNELATYYLYESEGNWYIKDVDGEEYIWNNEDGFTREVNKMITKHRGVYK